MTSYKCTSENRLETFPNSPLDIPRELADNKPIRFRAKAGRFMDYKYNSINELNHFDFAEAAVGDIQMADNMFHMVIDNVKILPENSFNRDIRTMRTNEMLFKIEGAEVISVVEEGYREYDADGNLKKKIEDATITPDKYKDVADALLEGVIYELKLEGGVYAFVIDGNNERTYEIKVAGSGDSESWNLFLNV